MIITKLQGGLGNQMFQYAAGRALSIKNNTTLKLDLSWFQDAEARPYLLDQFAIKAETATKKEIELFRGDKKEQFPNRIARIVSNTLNNRIYREKGFCFSKKIFSVSDNTYIKGYFQSDKYFNAITDTIKNEFSLINPHSSRHNETVNKISGCNSVSVHIRRGDYVSSKNASEYHGNLGIQYYQQAATLIAGKTTGTPHFFFFSDDIDWAKKYVVLDYPTTFIEGGNEANCHEEMHLMSICKHNIIANSTFSWWGAWLNNNTDKIVIAPENWFAKPKYNSNTQDIYPDSWLRV